MVYEMLGVSMSDFLINLFAILVSFIAAVYWVKLLSKIQISRKEDIGWVWIFMAVLMILFLNLGSIVLLFSRSQVYFGGLGTVFKFDASTISFMSTIARSIIALTITIGSYLLYKSIKGRDGVKFRLTPVIPVMEEDGSKVEAKFKLEPGCNYLVKEFSEGKLKAIDIFLDTVMHNEAGLYITRKYPPKLREELGLRKTPIFWLSRDKDYKDVINPSDLVSLTEVVKGFISKSDRCVVFLEGLEYLVVQNDFESVLKLIQSLDDSFTKTKSNLIVSVDPTAFDSRNIHLLERELKDFSQ